METQASQLVAQLVMAAGGGALLPILAKGVIGWVTGSQTREQAYLAQVIAQRNEAERARDVAAARARIAAEHASQLRRALWEAGITPPPWPEKPNDDEGENEDD